MVYDVVRMVREVGKGVEVVTSGKEESEDGGEEVVWNRVLKLRLLKKYSAWLALMLGISIYVRE